MSLWADGGIRGMRERFSEFLGTLMGRGVRRGGHSSISGCLGAEVRVCVWVRGGVGVRGCGQYVGEGNEMVFGRKVGKR